MWSLNLFFFLNLVIRTLSYYLCHLSFGYCNLNFGVYCRSNLQGKVSLEQGLLH